MTENVMELVQFRAAPGVSEATLVAAAAAIEPWLRACPGFLSRRLAVDEDRVWADCVVWSDMRAAQAAAKALPTIPSAAPFLEAIDMASVRMRHLTIRVAQ
jgi:hypothetical protein